MTFTDDLKAFALKAQAKNQQAFVGIVSTTQESITDGSPLTGAPGQPVDTGALKASWQTVFESKTEALIATNLVYAPGIEDGVGPHGPITLRSAVGGFHSVAATRAGFGRIVASEGAKVAAS